MRCCRPPPCPPPCPPPRPRPPRPWWAISKREKFACGFIRQPSLRGYPVPAAVRFRDWPTWPFPRRPWPFESETRAPGTGLALGRIPHRRPFWEVVW